MSSSSGTGSKKSQSAPGPIDNSNLVVEPSVKVTTLTGEGEWGVFVERIFFGDFGSLSNGNSEK